MTQESNPFPAADKSAIKRQILNIMRPVSVSRTGEDWKIRGLHFESALKNRANAHEPWSYVENEKKIGFACKEMRWSNGTIIKKGANASVGVLDTESSPVSLTYSDALGAGIGVKIIQDNYRWQKIVEIESLASLGEIPADAEYLEISFKVSGDFALPEGVIDVPVPFGKNSFFQPIRAWDSSPSPENPADEVKSGAIGVVDGSMITKRIPVAWLKSAVYPVQTDVTITYGAENVFNSAVTAHISVAALDSTHFVVAYKDDGGDDYGIARVGLVSGTTISSYGAENVFNSANTSYISVASLDATHFVVAYQDAGGDTHGHARIGLVSGTTISSYGAENTFNSANTSYISVAALDSTHFVVAYQDIGVDTHGHARVGLVSGTTISSYGAENTFNSAYTVLISVSALDNTHFVVAYKDHGGDTHGHARVGLVSGTTISSYGAENTFVSAVIDAIYVDALDSTHFVVVYHHTSAGRARIGLVSGTTISSYGAENTFNSVYTTRISVAALDATHFVVAYKDDGSADYGCARIGDVSGTTISSYGAENVFNSAITNYISVDALDSTHFVVAYQDAGNSSYGTAIVGETVAITVTPHWYYQMLRRRNQ